MAKVFKHKIFAVKLPEYEDTVLIKWEQDEIGNHRLVNITHSIHGTWYGYGSPAYLAENNVIIFTEYSKGMFPVETLMSLTLFPLITEIESSNYFKDVQHNDDSN